MKLLVKGVPASRGLAIGRVRHVSESGAPLSLDSGGPLVLVAAAAAGSIRRFVLGTDGAGEVGGIVVERGGSLCSLATTARELGVPAVFGAADALSLLREGEVVLLDGAAGAVYELGEGVFPTDLIRTSALTGGSEL